MRWAHVCFHCSFLVFFIQNIQRLSWTHILIPYVLKSWLKIETGEENSVPKKISQIKINIILQNQSYLVLYGCRCQFSSSTIKRAIRLPILVPYIWSWGKGYKRSRNGGEIITPPLDPMSWQPDGSIVRIYATSHECSMIHILLLLTITNFCFSKGKYLNQPLWTTTPQYSYPGKTKTTAHSSTTIRYQIIRGKTSGIGHILSLEYIWRMTIFSHPFFSENFRTP